MNGKIIPVILAGGSGTRLWPLSRKSFPKQFLKLVGNRSLLQETVVRTKEVIDFSHLIVMTNILHRHLCEEQLKTIAFDKPVSYILEPCGRNTAPAIAIAARYIRDRLDEKALMLVLPSDHLIAEVEELSRSLMRSLQSAESGRLVIFGVTPNGPKTGYGYIHADQRPTPPPYPVKTFIEKPPSSQAKALISKGDYYWNSGMFLFRPSSYLSELKQLAAAIYKSCANSYRSSSFSENTLVLDPDSFSKCPTDSIDYAVMEKTSNAVTMPLNTRWNDLGSWGAIAETQSNNLKKNVIYGNVIEKHSTNCFIHSDNRLVSIIGLDNTVVISTRDAILVANKDHLDEVKEVVDELDATHTAVVENHRKVFFNWGYEEVIEKDHLAEQKRIVIKPDATFSENPSGEFSKHCLFISGKGAFRSSRTASFFKANEGVHLAENEGYEIKNIGKKPLILIETTVKSNEVSSIKEKAPSV
ncbi:MAG: mannose-1-phosphate guanylyltransferase/mannose-6-phosphate isomerase [Chlamydiota bacterium]